MFEEWERMECGYYGIKEEECVETNGCCWMPANDPSIPWCFSPGGKLQDPWLTLKDTETS